MWCSQYVAQIFSFCNVLFIDIFDKIDNTSMEHLSTVTYKTITMFGTLLMYTLWCLYACKSHFMLVRDIGEPTTGYT
jgi:hypothetical protein